MKESSVFRLVKTKLPRARIRAVSPFWDFAAPPPELEALGQSVKQDVSDVGGTYLNVGSTLAGQRQYFSADGVHPNPDGYRRLGAAVDAGLKWDQAETRGQA